MIGVILKIIKTICQGIKIKMRCLLQALAVPDFCIHFPGLPNHFSMVFMVCRYIRSLRFHSKIAEHHISKNNNNNNPDLIKFSITERNRRLQKTLSNAEDV